MTYSLLWNVTRYTLVVSYGHFDKTSRFHLQDTSVRLGFEDGTDRLSRNVGNYQRATTQKSEDLTSF